MKDINELKQILSSLLPADEFAQWENETDPLVIIDLINDLECTCTPLSDACPGCITHMRKRNEVTEIDMMIN